MTFNIRLRDFQHGLFFNIPFIFHSACLSNVLASDSAKWNRNSEVAKQWFVWFRVSVWVCFDSHFSNETYRCVFSCVASRDSADRMPCHILRTAVERVRRVWVGLWVMHVEWWSMCPLDRQHCLLPTTMSMIRPIRICVRLRPPMVVILAVKHATATTLTDLTVILFARLWREKQKRHCIEWIMNAMIFSSRLTIR